MATDIKTTNERVDILVNASNSLRQAAKLCQDAQRYHDTCSDYGNRAENVAARMANIKSLIQAVANELTEMSSDANMEFQFEWVAGRHGAQEITVVSSTQTIFLSYENAAGSNYVASAFVNALSVGDIVRLKDSLVNSLHYTVSTMPTATGVKLHGPVQPLRDESLLFRVVKELKG